ncbi:hypothetical protein A7U60_g5606 [Sanghuangporus baumii]|uniref:Uncharacterized protein n=1 Tax=Sanghuangporus baumii TaxID=108892 RepID=A0A9Q5HWG3_SANBA|nr:hypothetical protein A7U60_g5606 [Sanghuangporus baumii]
MPTRTDAQRLELKDHFRRAANDYNRQSQFRRCAFMRMLELAKEPDLDSFCKKLIVERVKDFFIDFPEFQDEAINIVYDMCEDQDQEVRIAGYGAITSVSKVDKSWLMRNADVLVQLLQSDDPREVAVVKRALQQHVDLDPRGTLQVLCEQCVLNPADLGDDEERLLRSRLRSLVLQFLADKYRVCIIRVVKNQEVESILLKGMLEAIPQASPSEVHMIVTDILLNLPSLSRGPSQSGNAVLQTLLDAVKLSLEAEQTDINKLCQLLEEAVRVVTPLSLATHSTSSGFPPLRTQSMHSMPAADGLQVLKFFADYSLLDRVPCGAALKVAECLCATCDSTSTPENKNSSSVQFLGLAPGLLTMLRRCLPTQRIEVTSRSCHAVLRAIEEQINVTKEDFLPPPSLAAALDALIHEIGSMTSDTDTKITQTADANTVEAMEARAHQLPDDARQAMEISRKSRVTIHMKKAVNPIRADLWSRGRVLRFFAEAADEEEKDGDIMLLSDLLMDSEPRRRPLLHEVVDEEPCFWTSRRLIHALGSDNVQETALEFSKLKRTRDDADQLGEEGSASEIDWNVQIARF